MATGSLQTKQGKKGEMYYAVLNLEDKRKWISLHLPVKNNKKLAQQKLKDLLARYDETPGMFQKVPFTDYIEEWKDREKSLVDIVTWEGYCSYLDKHVIPYFEPLKLNIQDVSVQHLEAYYSYKSTGGRLDGKPGGLSNRTVRLHNIVLNLIMKDAVGRNILPSNPNERAKVPKNNSTNFKGTFFTIEQMNELLRLFNGTPVRDMITITCLYGLRRSELMGLRWSAIDFTNDTLVIQHTVVLHDTIVIKDKTKNPSSNRCYPLLPEIKDILLRIKAKQEVNKVIFGNCYNDTGYVFTREDGEMLYPSYASHRLRKVLAKSDLPKNFRWHDLRHSTANLLFAKGWSMKDVSEWLGHSSIATTMNIYTHVDISRKRSLSKGLEGLLA